MPDTTNWSRWTRFWHQPVRAERLAITRILLAFFLLTDLLYQYLPFLETFYGPEGLAPAGTFDVWLMQTWQWTILIFNTDNLAILYPLFWLRVAVVALFLIGWQTRIMSVLTWFFTLCWIARNPSLRNGAEDVMMAGLFLLMFAQTGKALSVDAWLRRRKLPPDQAALPAYAAPWPLRLIQIQICVLYLTTGLAKLIRGPIQGAWNDEWFVGTWWDGTSIHYVLCDITMVRWPIAQFQLPFWLTATITYAGVWWETLFLPLVLWRWTRPWALLFGLFFHLGIFLTIEIGWFSFYTVSLYAVWIPDRFWDHRLPTRAAVRNGS